MRFLLKALLITVILFSGSSALSAADITIKITKRYLNIPVSQREIRGIMQFKTSGKAVRSFKIRLATDKPDYWVFCDMSAFKRNGHRPLFMSLA